MVDIAASFDQEKQSPDQSKMKFDGPFTCDSSIDDPKWGGARQPPHRETLAMWMASGATGEPASDRNGVSHQGSKIKRCDPLSCDRPTNTIWGTIMIWTLLGLLWSAIFWGVS